MSCLLQSIYCVTVKYLEYLFRQYYIEIIKKYVYFIILILYYTKSNFNFLKRRKNRQSEIPDINAYTHTYKPIITIIRLFIFYV